MEQHFGSLQSVDGGAWSPERFQARWTVLSWTDQGSQAVSVEAGRVLGRRFMERQDFQLLTAVKVPSMFKGLATALLRSGQVKAREGAAKGFLKAGKEAPADLEQRIHVLFDLDGKVAKTVFPEWKDGAVRLVLVGPDGSIVHRTQDRDIESAVEEIAERLP